ncbi:MAG: SulP family inorganic anion transporter [Vicingaceae bacterium]
MNIFSQLKHDIPASVVVFFVAIPLCLGIALASGAPLFSGLIAGIVGGIVVGSLSGSSLGVSGPAAGLAVIVLSAIQELDSYQVFLVAVMVAGIIQLILGLAKAGIIGYFFPSSVIKGMLTGIGLIIILKQIPHAFGYDGDYEGDLNFSQKDGENTFTELINMLDYIEPQAVLVSIVSLFIMIFWDNVLKNKGKFFEIIQGPFVAVTFGILYQVILSGNGSAWAFDNQHLVNVPVADDFNSFVGQFSLPDFSAITNPQVYVIGATMAVVASLETLLSVDATDKLDPKKRVTPTNRELIAQGTGNVVSGFIGGLPITQVIVRSSANIQSGGKTKMSAIIHGFLLLISVIFIPKVLNFIPLSVLAAILFVVGFKLAKPSLFRRMYQLGYKQFLPFIVTIVGIVFSDLLTGIGLGVAVAVFIILRNNFKNSHFLHKKEASNDDNKIMMTLAEEVTFLNKAAIQQELNNLKEGSEVTIDVRNSVRVDYDVYEIIANFMRNTAKDRNITIHLKSNQEINIADY